MGRELRYFIILCIAVAIGIMVLPQRGKCDPSIMDVATYESTGLSQINWEELTFDGFLLDSIQAEPGVDLAGIFHVLNNKPKAKPLTKLETLIIYNKLVNLLFPYKLGAFNLWHAQTPKETIARMSGDCKALAVFKYHLLKQLGFKNVKAVTVALADGRGSIAGHVVVLVDDIWVLDINPPYVYTFAELRFDNALEKSFDETGVHVLKHLGE